MKKKVTTITETEYEPTQERTIKRNLFKPSVKKPEPEPIKQEKPGTARRNARGDQGKAGNAGTTHGIAGRPRDEGAHGKNRKTHAGNGERPGPGNDGGDERPQ